MSADGQVRIIIDTNANEAVKQLDAVDNSFNKNAKDGRQLSSVYNALEKEAQEYTEKLRAMAIGGGQNSKEFQRLAQHVRDVKATLNETNNAVDKAIGGFDMQGNGMNNLAGLARNLIGGYLGIQGAIKAFNYAMESVQAFRTQERAIASLNNALQNAGAYSYEYSQAIQQLASEIQGYSNFEDDAVIKAQALGQAYIGNTRITIELTKATVDFAAATGMDLEQAFSLVGKAVGSQTNALARYGIQLQKGMSDTQKMDAITKQLGERYQGQAALMADGTIQLKNAIGDLSESFGRILDPAVNKSTNYLIKLANALKVAMDRAYAARAEINKLDINQTADKITSLYLKEEKLNQKLSLYARNKQIVAKTQKELQEVQRQIKEAENHALSLARVEKQKAVTSASRGFKMTDDFGISPVSNSGVSRAVSSPKVQQMKDDYEKLQESVNKAKREIQLAAIAHGTSSAEVQNAFTRYRELNTQLTNIDALFSDQKIKVEETKTEFQKLNEKIQETKEKLQEIYLTEGQSETFNTYKNQLVQLETQLQDMNTAITSKIGVDWEYIGNSIRSNLSSALLTPLQQGESAFQRLGSIGLNVVQMIGSAIIKNMLEQITLQKTLNALKAIGKALGGFFGLPFENGGVFQNGNVIPFAKGGIVNKPTIFPMANGGTGLMGEAGAEAVMPLRRMSNGRLGVEADAKGNGTVVNIYNQSQSQIETRKRDNGSMDIIIKRVNEALMNERTSSGFRAAYQREDKKGLQAV